MMLKTATLVLLLAVVGSNLAHNFCDLCLDHTMCIYRTRGQRCGRVIRSGLTGTERLTVVAAHNELRARVAAGDERAGINGGQPSAANMRKLVWDDELAIVAQRWTDQCQFGHDYCRNVQRFIVGQNVYTQTSSGSHNRVGFQSVVSTWYSEVHDFDRNNIAPFRFSPGPQATNYTQVVWAESSRIGCGLTQFPDDQMTKFLVACNYGPGGLVTGRGTTMYKPGRACSQCPQGTTCQNSLCA